jgi:N-acetylglutamate synthase-like GNAT family acetyltransferase
MEIRRARPDDSEPCVAVLAELPEYFTPSTFDDVRRDLATNVAWVAVDDGTVVGFVLATRRFAAAAELTFAAVSPSRHGRHIGTTLVERVFDELAADGVRMVEVKTLDASSGYEPYVATRAFWEARGFVQVDCIDPLPGWEPGNPSAIYVTALDALP